MGGRLAIMACDGALPVHIAKAYPEALCITLAGVQHQLEGAHQQHRIEKLGSLFAALKEAGVERMVFAGALTRPALNPVEFDEAMITIAPRLLAAMQAGDDGLLRQVIEIFEERGFSVVGAHELLPELTATEGLHFGPQPSDAEHADVARAWEVLRGLSGLDVGQGCVVAGGQVLGIETVQGTDAMLGFVGATPEHLRRGARGVFVKAAKQGQDLRIDMPAIGPDTIEAVAAVGLAGLVIEAGRVMILDRKKTLQDVERAGIFLIAQAL